MARFTIIISAIFGILSVSLGAFGAHALKDKLIASTMLGPYETAVKYQFFHTILLLVLGLLHHHYKSQWLNYSVFSTLAGIILFSGSLYLLSLSGQTFWGVITPIGGVLLILGWAFLGLGIFASGNKKSIQ